MTDDTFTILDNMHRLQLQMTAQIERLARTLQESEPKITREDIERQLDDIATDQDLKLSQGCQPNQA